MTRRSKCESTLASIDQLKEEATQLKTTKGEKSDKGPESRKKDKQPAKIEKNKSEHSAKRKRASDSTEVTEPQRSPLQLSCWKKDQGSTCPRDARL